MGAGDGGAGAAPALRAGRRPGRARDRRGGAGAARGARHRRSPAGPQINLFFGGVQAVARDPRDRRPQRRRRPAPRRRRRVADRRDGDDGARSTSRPRACSTTSRARRARRGWRCSSELAAEGVPLEELREAVAAGRLTLLPVERALAGDGRRYTPREIAEIAGIDLELLQRFSAALGVPYPDPDERAADRGRPRGGAADEGVPRRRPARGRDAAGGADDRDGRRRGSPRPTASWSSAR